MIGYAEKEVFSKHELELYRRAVNLLKNVPYEFDDEPVRCHELARAVGKVLSLEYEDGRFGFVEHTWLWTKPPGSEEFCAPWAQPNILDVYVPGSVPSVQLVHMATGLPARYMLAHFPVNVRSDVVRRLEDIFNKELKK